MLRSLKKMAVGAAALALVLTACGTGGQAPEEAPGTATQPPARAATWTTP